MAERPLEDGDYVCSHCHVVYGVYGDRTRCDLCNRKLKWENAEELIVLSKKWIDWEKARGLPSDFAYKR